MNLVTFFILVSLFASCFSVGVESELKKSIEKIMKCRYRDPPKGPVMAVTPSRFAQIVVILHERFQTPACVKPSKFPVDLNDEATWPFCVFGRCVQGQCQCAGHFEGPKCSRYARKCWLMYCYLTSCHPSHQSLHCICDPKLYGTNITSGIYWYNSGVSSRYVPPPPGWKDDPVNVIGWSDQSSYEQESEEKHQIPNGFPAPKAEFPRLNAPELFKNYAQTGRKNRPSYPKAIASVPGFDSAGRIMGSKSKNKKENSNRDSVAKGTEKSDVEEALEELEEVSAALKSYSNSIHILVLILLAISFQHDARLM